jgi:TetR/AcrR family transcriptional regulator, tetracycline repressor protein
VGTTQDKPPAKTRGRGESAGIDLTRIVKAARGMQPHQITMQAVADALGVDRKALSHHVRDWETLLAVVAFDAFAEQFSRVHVGPADDWQQATRNYARAYVDSLTATGPLVEHFNLSDSFAVGIFQPSEKFTAILISSGFDDEAAARALALLSTICLGHVRDSVMASRFGEHPRSILLRRALERSGPHQFENLARIAASRLDLYNDVQFNISIEVFLRGVAATLGPGRVQ